MSAAGRLEGVDAARALAIAGVVHLHLGPFRAAAWEGTPAGFASDLAALAARTAVPFFFVAAGYFFTRRLAGGAAPVGLLRKQSVRLLLLYAAWSVLYVAAASGLRALNRRSLAEGARLAAERVAWARERPVTFLLQGPQEHLWFLPALAIGLAVAALSFGRGRWPRLAWFAGALYAVALLGGSYAATPLGLDLGFNPRNGPFVSVPFVLIGALVAAREARGEPLPRGGPLLAGGLLLSLLEALLLLRLSGRDVASHDALAGLLLAGPGLFLLAREAWRRPPAGLVRAGRLTLGVYAAHVLVALPLAAVRPPGAAGELALPVLAYAATLAAVALVARVPRLAPLVS